MSDKTSSARTHRGDAAWIVPFFVIITSGLGFLFWQMAQYGLMPH